MFVVHVYAEGGVYDSEAFVAGPFDSESDATLAEGALIEYGMTEVLPVYDNVQQLAKLLHEGRS